MPDTKISAGADPVTLVATDKVPMARTASTTAYAATMTELAAFTNTAYVPNYFAGTPSMDGTAAPGTAAFVSRGDHVHPSDTSRMARAGTTTNDNAAAGNVGEYIASEVTTGISLSTTVGANITSISLTGGDWDVDGIIAFTNAGGAAPSLLQTWVSQTSGSADAATALGHAIQSYSGTAAGAVFYIPTGTRRFSLSATTTVYVGAYAQFASGTVAAVGAIRARRMR